MDGDIPFTTPEDEEDEDQVVEFQNIGLKKNKMTPEEHCLSEESKLLIPFIKAVFKLKFNE
jgi:hypothetical protein